MLHFTKMHGCGNDYVYMDCTCEMIKDPGALAKRVSDRHFGVGSDGLILIAPSTCADFRMVMFNADGTEGAMCGNGIRCVAKFVYDKGLTDQTHISVETKSGIKYLDLTVENGVVTQVRVDMGAPSVAAADLPVVGLGDPVIEVPVTVEGQTFQMTCVSMGNPHGILWVEDVNTCPLETVGPKLETGEMFPDRCNIEFAHVVDRHTVEMRVWERGAGETWACGTGACATAYACWRTGKTENVMELRLRGGNLMIEYDEAADRIYMTGPAVTVFEGCLEE
jgi:diaminopimelate epimerase